MQVIASKAEKVRKTNAPGQPETFPASPALTVREAAAFLRVGRNTVFELIAGKRLPVARIGRAFLIPRWACESLLEAQWQASVRPLGVGKV